MKPSLGGISCVNMRPETHAQAGLISFVYTGLVRVFLSCCLTALLSQAAHGAAAGQGGAVPRALFQGLTFLRTTPPPPLNCLRAFRRCAHPVILRWMWGRLSFSRCNLVQAENYILKPVVSHHRDFPPTTRI